MKTLFLTALSAFTLWPCLPVNCSGGAGAVSSVVKTEVKVIGGHPRILIDGRDSVTFVNRMDYLLFPGRSDYGDGTWLKGVKKQIGAMKAKGANTLILDIFWPDLDRSARRPADIGAALNFAPLDEAMRYAAQNDIHVMIDPKIDTFLAGWWQRERGFPEAVKRAMNEVCIPQEKDSDHACVPEEICAPGDDRCCGQPREALYCCDLDRQNGAALMHESGLPMCAPFHGNPAYSRCSDCETDSYGWKYNVPSMGSEAFKKDYSAYLTALVNRYKSNPALIGWVFSLGPSGEDEYGPSYIVLSFGVYGGLKGISEHPGQVADYSESAQKMFRSWLRGRYASDSELARAWGEDGLTLAAAKLPDPKKLLKEGKDGPFPDNFFTVFWIDLSDLTRQGRDLYDFREHVRDEYRAYFTGLIKRLDGGHILGLFGGNNAAIYRSPYIDAVLNSNHVEYSRDGYAESNLIAILGELSNKYGKANIFTVESTGPGGAGLSGSNPDKARQKAALLRSWKTIKCLGAYPGYTSGVLRSDPVPSWGRTDMQILGEIGSYAPRGGCICDLVPPNAKVLNRRTVAELARIFGLRDYTCTKNGETGPDLPDENAPGAEGAEEPPAPGRSPCMDSCTKKYSDPVKCSSQCGVVLPVPAQSPGGGAGGSGGGGKCGDGTCDDFERSNGMCPRDCR